MRNLKWAVILALVCCSFGCAGMNATDQRVLSGRCHGFGRRPGGGRHNRSAPDCRGCGRCCSRGSGWRGAGPDAGKVDERL